MTLSVLIGILRKITKIKINLKHLDAKYNNCIIVLKKCKMCVLYIV